MTTPPDQRDFARMEFEWLREVARDGELPSIALRTAVVLTLYFNEKTRLAWPSVLTLAGQLAVGRRQIQRGTDALLKRGYLTISGSRKGGRGLTNHYQLRLGVPPLPKGRQHCHPLDQKRVTDSDQKGVNPGNKGRQICHPNTSKEHSLEHSSATDLSKMDAKSWFASDTRSAARITAYEAFKHAPPKALNIDTQISKFAEFNRGKRLSDEEWRTLWERWCQQAVEYARKAS